MRIVKHILRTVLWILLIILVGAVLALQVPSLQRRAAQKATQVLSQKAGIHVNVGKVYFVFFNHLLLTDVSIPCHESDTLFFTNKLSIRIRSVNPFRHTLRIARVGISGGGFHLVTGGDQEPNVAQCFASPNKTAVKDSLQKKKFKWDIRADQVELDDFQFTLYHRLRGEEVRSPQSINFSNMDVSSIHIDIRNVLFANGVLHARLKDLQGTEKSGYIIRHMEGDVSVDNKAAVVENLLFQDDYSRLTARFYKMIYGHSKSFNDYVNKVRMELDMDNAFISFRTIRYFAQGGIKDDFTMGLHLSGLVEGPVSNLSSSSLDVHSQSGATHLIAGFKMRGLVEVPQTTLQVDIRQLNSTIKDLNAVLYSIAGVTVDYLESTMDGRTPFQFQGRLTGLLTDFAVDGKLNGAFGNMNVDMVVNSNASPSGVLLSGLARAHEVDLQYLVKSPLLGKVSLFTRAQALFPGKGQGGIQASIDSLSIDSLVFNQYPIKGFRAKGDLRNNTFNGRMACSDPNMNFLFQGRLNLPSDKRSQLGADFFAHIAYVDLHKLDVIKNDSIARLSGVFGANFSSINSLGDINGQIYAQELSFSNSHGTHALHSLQLESGRTDSTHYHILLDSDALQGSYSGQEGIMTFVNKLRNNHLHRHLPSVFTSSDTTFSQGGTYRLELTFLNTAFIEELLMPGLYIAPQTRLEANYFPNDSLLIQARSGRIGYRKNNLKDLEMKAISNTRSLQALILTDNATVASADLNALSVDCEAAGDSSSIHLSYFNSGALANNADLTAHIQFARQQSSDSIQMLLRTSPSQLTLNGKRWQIETSGISYTPGSIHIGQFRFYTPSESLVMAGALSKNPHDTLSLALNHLDASLLNSFINQEKYPFQLHGSFTGQGQITDFFDARKFFVDITGDSFRVNDSLAGDMRILSAWDAPNRQVKLGIQTTLPDNSRPLNLVGFYRPSDRQLNINAQLKHFQAALVSPFLSGLVSDVHGFIDGDFLLSGPMQKLNATSSDAYVEDLNFTVDFTKVPYILNGPLQLTEQGIFLPQNPITDQFGHKGTAKGGIFHRHFQDLNIDLELMFENLHALNTNETDNDSFYGNAFATGNMSIKGPLDHIAMDMSIRSEPSTVIHIPLSSAANAKQTELLTFVEEKMPEIVSRDPYTREEALLGSKKKRTQLSLNMKTEVTPDAQMLLEINKSTGDVISGKGSGRITLGIDPSREDFSILGDCSIESGEYLFVLQGLLSKKFQIVPGGTITFNGDILNTQLNLAASYRTKASLNTLLSDTSSVANRREVDCRLLMTGNLMNPTLGFDIDIDDIDPTTRARVESTMNTEDKLMRQFMTLLISSSFIPEQESGIVNNSSLLYSNATEILSNQLNNILAQLNIPLDVGFNYQPGTEGRDIFDVAVSTQLFNNRVVVNGNMGNSPYSGNNDIVGNVDIELKLDEKGKLRLKAFSHAADQYSNYLDNTQRNGGGFVYQDEFSTFRQLWERWFKKKKR